MLLQQDNNFNLLIFWRTRQILIYSIGMVLLSIGLIAFGAYPQITATLELNAEAQKKRPQLEVLERKMAQLENVRFDPDFSQVDVVNEALPSKKPLLELLTNLNAISLANNINVTGFQLNPGLVASSAAEAQLSTRKKGDIDTLDVELTIEGERGDVNKFLSSVEMISPFTTIIKLTISTTKVGEIEKSVAQLTTNTFFFTKSIKTTIDSPLPALAANEKTVLTELASFEIPELSEQTEITGGGLEDLFGVDPLLFND